MDKKETNQPSTNHPFSEVIDFIHKEILSKLKSGETYYFRGESQKFQSSCSSTLYRFIFDGKSEKNKNTLQEVLKQAEEEIYEKAKPRSNYEDKDSVFAEVQHFDGKTNLIDFSANLHIALFFACQDKPSEEGCIFALSEKDIDGDKTLDKLAIHLKENRFIAQSSVFIRSQYGYIESKKLKSFTVLPEKKEITLQYLKTICGISQQTIFPDLQGFIKNEDNFQTAIVHLYKGIKFQVQGKFAKAITEYDKAIELKPDYAEAYNNRGLAKVQKGDIEGAIKDLDKAIELKPDYAKVYNNRGIAKGKKGDIEGAIKDFDKAIELKPNFAEAYYNRGLAKVQKGDIEGAIKDLDKAIELNPNDAEVYYNRGIAKGQIGDIEGEIKDYDKAIELKPNYAKAYYNRGIAKGQIGDIEGAIKDFDKAIELKPNLAEAYVNRGVAKEQKGDIEGAIKDYDKAIELKPNLAEAYYNRGVAKEQKGDIEGAVADLKKAQKLGFELPPEAIELLSQKLKN